MGNVIGKAQVVQSRTIQEQINSKLTSCSIIAQIGMKSQIVDSFWAQQSSKKLYLSMEEWFHDSHPKDEVHRAGNAVVAVMKSKELYFQEERIAMDITFQRCMVLQK